MKKNLKDEIKIFDNQIDTLTDYDIEIIQKMGKEEILHYPKLFLESNVTFLESTDGSGFLLDNNNGVKDFVAEKMHKKLRGNFTECCGVCARTCLVQDAYKVPIPDLPPICEKVLQNQDINLSPATIRFYDISD